MRLARVKAPAGSRTVAKKDAETLTLDAVPDFGTYSFRWKRRYLLTITNTRTERTNQGQYGFPSKELSVTLSMWGTSKREILLEIVREAKTLFGNEHSKHLYYYSLANEGWTANTLAPRPLSTIYLPTSTISLLTDDIQRFLDSADQYRDLGIPYRRGYLVDGPPGTGKTSLVQAVAAHFELPLYYVNLNSGRLTSDNLADYFRQLQAPCLVLFEDVDCISAARDRSSTSEKNHLSTADLLNVLDGIIAGDNRIVIMTTNYPDRLDSALTRAGRVDIKVHIDYPSKDDVKRFYDRAAAFFDLPDWENFSNALPVPHTIGDAQALAFQSGSRFKNQMQLALSSSDDSKV